MSEQLSLVCDDLYPMSRRPIPEADGAEHGIYVIEIPPKRYAWFWSEEAGTWLWDLAKKYTDPYHKDWQRVEPELIARATGYMTLASALAPVSQAEEGK